MVSERWITADPKKRATEVDKMAGSSGRENPVNRAGQDEDENTRDAVMRSFGDMG